MKHPFALLVLGLGLQPALLAHAAEAVAPDNNYWSDVPPATKNYTASRDVIVHHIDDLVRETLQGRN